MAVAWAPLTAALALTAIISQRSASQPGAANVSLSEERLLNLAVSFCGQSAAAQIMALLVADMSHELEGARGLQRMALQLRWEAAFFATLDHTLVCRIGHGATIVRVFVRPSSRL